ncbi:GFA family protein [uncultured Alsobacter sp.]|uniref:GFA family protein n=1 Tax=uncultured Alsobacter sp. TaxID=1748258 RepID=UPI0025EC7C61|nr:GFA family protein [uncultured Alsobacter sp.]
MREASCSCGHLKAVCEGDPVMVSLCHCLSCQRRTGSAFSVQAWFPQDRVTAAGDATVHSRQGESGGSVHFWFCPSCGGTVFWQADTAPGMTAVAVGCFADPSFPGPLRSIWERRQHRWTDALRSSIATHQD